MNQKGSKIAMDLNETLSIFQIENYLSYLFDCKVSINIDDQQLEHKHRPTVWFYPSSKSVNMWKQKYRHVLKHLLQQNYIIFDHGILLFNNKNHKPKDMASLWVSVQETASDDTSITFMQRAIELGYDSVRKQNIQLLSTDNHAFVLLSPYWHTGESWYKQLMYDLIAYFEK